MHTLLTEGNFMSDFDWGEIDFQKLVKGFGELQQVRGKIIDDTILLEFHLDVVICKILFNSYVSKEAILFRKFALPQNFGFYAKVCFLENIVESNTPPKAHLTKQWLDKLKTINTIRNFLAHGIQSSGLPLKNQEEQELAVSLIKKGKYKETKITKAWVEEINKDIRFCLNFVLHEFVKKGLKSYFG